MVANEYVARMKTSAARSIPLLAFLITLAASAAPVRAHHSFSAEFDASKPANVKGTVTKVEWENPHVWFYLDVKDESGKLNNWGIEMGSPNGLMRIGWSRNSMKVGDVVTVEGSRAKDGSNTVNARSVTLASSGKKLFASSSQGQ
jgi:hypothetical protein